MKRAFPVEVLWCGNRSGFAARCNGWSFPSAVHRQILADTKNQSVLHLFGGLSKFGTLLDIDMTTKPHVVGDAWLPPFAGSSFDVVVLDPPYFRLNQQEKNQLLNTAAWLARRTVIWFHTIWIAGDRQLVTEKAYLVRVGDTCQVRCLQYFTVGEKKRMPKRYFERGPGMKYNRWIQQPTGFAFESQP